MKPLFDHFKVPEYQLRAPNYPKYQSTILGELIFTGGYMEPEGHSFKKACRAMFEDGEFKYLPPSRRNLGVDYFLPNNNIRAWYPGRVFRISNEGGYGLRCHIAYNFELLVEGIWHRCYGAYAHAESFAVKEGDKITQGMFIGKQGSSGGNYAPHVDYRCGIGMGVMTDISPNWIDMQIRKGLFRPTLMGQ